MCTAALGTSQLHHLFPVCDNIIAVILIVFDKQKLVVTGRHCVGCTLAAGFKAPEPLGKHA